jgi:MFS transporter, DHA2 family, methylenomycin A resistance protein
MTRRQALVLTASGGVAAMTTIDTTVVNVALPSIRSEFNASITSVQWVVTSYTVVFAILMVPAGRIADMVGRERVWAAGVATFAIASLGCGLAPNLGLLCSQAEWLKGSGPRRSSRRPWRWSLRRFRPTVGVGRWASWAPLSRAPPPSVRQSAGRSPRRWGGGRSSWSTCPSPLPAILVMRHLGAPAARAAPGGAIDVTGAGLLGSCLLLIILALTQGDDWGGPWTFGLLAAAAALGVAFVNVELRRDAPVLELRLLRRAAFAAGNAITLLTSLGFFGAFFLQSLYLQKSRASPSWSRGCCSPHSGPRPS